MPVKDVVHMFKALADPTRLRIMLLLRVRELCVCELTYILGMEQSRISHQMRILREAGLAEDIRQGRWMIYRIPARSRQFIESLFASLEGARLGRSAPRNEDARKLAACVSENIRPRDCDGRPGPAGPRSQPGRRGLHG
jgi:ArsR family transcriptional regulator